MIIIEEFHNVFDDILIGEKRKIVADYFFEVTNIRKIRKRMPPNLNIYGMKFN